MTIYEKRFYEDIHKLVIIQGKILKELEKLNKPLQEDKEYVVPVEKMREMLNAAKQEDNDPFTNIEIDDDDLPY